MAGGHLKWTEKKIQRMEADGHGQGVGAASKPWIEVNMVSSLGRSRRVWSPKTDRTHHLLSDVEYRLFLALEWPTAITDIREQFPLDRDVTQDVARQLGIRHPYYPATQVPTVMTVDFLVTRIRDGCECLEAFNAKRTEEAEDENSLAKLEIQRATLELIEIPHHLVFHSDIPAQKVKNIDWIRDSLVKAGESEPRPGFWGSMTSRMTQALTKAAGASSVVSLSHFCTGFDATHGAEPGTGLRVARMLMFERILSVNLSAPNLVEAPVTDFVLTGSFGKLRAVGGR